MSKIVTNDNKLIYISFLNVEKHLSKYVQFEDCEAIGGKYCFQYKSYSGKPLLLMPQRPSLSRIHHSVLHCPASVIEDEA